MNKVSLNDFFDCWTRWQKSNRTLRFGQMFLNEFYPSVSDPDIFYEEHPKVAYRKVHDKYVK